MARKVVELEPDLLSDEKLEKTPTLTSKSSSKKSKKLDSPKADAKKKSKKPLFITLIVLLILALGAAAVWYFCFYQKSTKNSNNDNDTTETTEPETKKIYSRLTGLEISDAKEDESPVFCVQIPNDTYGARPQVGLNHAAIVFEAIAEGGITRTAAIFQNLDDSVIGPIRSLRTYYLDWETPFDCTLVHAGGEEVARKTAANGSYRDLTESNVYMYRDTRGYKAPNNLFTSTSLLTKFNSDKSYTSSNPQVFARQTPLEAETIAKTVQANASSDGSSSSSNSASSDSSSSSSNSSSNSSSTSSDTASELKPVSKIQINFGNLPNFNTVYEYDAKTNSYARSFASGAEHIVYSCRAGLDKPSPKQECGDPVQLSPNVVVAMMVDEYTKSNTRENIQTIGSGTAYVFQNGSVIKGTWSKASQKEQIVFTDEHGGVIKLAPGQLWIAAVPNSQGSVKY